MRSRAGWISRTRAAREPAGVGCDGIIEPSELGEVAAARERRTCTAQVHAERLVEDTDREGVGEHLPQALVRRRCAAGVC